MKNFKNLLKTTLSSNVRCQYHDEKFLPNLRPLEYCSKCQVSLCYSCGNKHIDQFCNVEWGSEVFDNIQPPHNEINDKFNRGHPYELDLKELKCPCGAPFLSKMTSTICSACGTATCSAECHDKYLQKDKKCSYINNFVSNTSTEKIQGLRTITVMDFINAMKHDFPPLTPTSIASPKFIRPMISFSPFKIILQRGFRQYGQPHTETLDSFNELESQEVSKELFDRFATRLCMCDCEACDNLSPHPVYNCTSECQKKEEVTEEEKVNLGLYKTCLCHCVYCVQS